MLYIMAHIEKRFYRWLEDGGVFSVPRADYSSACFDSAIVGFLLETVFQSGQISQSYFESNC